MRYARTHTRSHADCVQCLFTSHDHHINYAVAYEMYNRSPSLSVHSVCVFMIFERNTFAGMCRVAVVCLIKILMNPHAHTSMHARRHRTLLCKWVEIKLYKMKMRMFAAKHIERAVACQEHFPACLPRIQSTQFIPTSIYTYILGVDMPRGEHIGANEPQSGIYCLYSYVNWVTQASSWIKTVQQASVVVVAAVKSTVNKL